MFNNIAKQQEITVKIKSNLIISGYFQLLLILFNLKIRDYNKEEKDLIFIILNLNKETFNLIYNKLYTMSVEEHIFLARVAEQAERFDDMVDFLKPVLD